MGVKLEKTRKKPACSRFTGFSYVKSQPYALPAGALALC